MSRHVPPIVKPSKCSIWRHQLQGPCQNNATTWMYGPGDEDPVPGAACESCARRIIVEIRVKMGEVWTMEPAAMI